MNMDLTVDLDTGQSVQDFHTPFASCIIWSVKFLYADKKKQYIHNWSPIIFALPLPLSLPISHMVFLSGHDMRCWDSLHLCPSTELEQAEAGPSSLKLCPDMASLWPGSSAGRPGFCCVRHCAERSQVCGHLYISTLPCPNSTLPLHPVSPKSCIFIPLFTFHLIGT